MALQGGAVRLDCDARKRASVFVGDAPGDRARRLRAEGQRRHEESCQDEDPPEDAHISPFPKKLGGILAQD
jgi:hypothetical protein